MTTRQTPIDNFVPLKELLEEKFTRIEEKIDSNHNLQSEISNNILQQTTRTNGRVNKLEDKIAKLEDEENKHTSNCPRLPDLKELNQKIDAINSDLSEVRIIKKYPKTSIFLLVAVIIYFLGSIAYGVYQFHEFAKETQKIETKVETLK